MNPEHDTHSEWEPCRPGEIGGMVRRLRGRRRRAFAWQAAGMLVMGMLLGSLYVGARDAALVRPGGEYRCGGIACSEVRARGEEYLMGRLEPGLHRQVEFHLKRCPECGPLLRKMMPPEAGHAAASSADMVSTRHSADAQNGCRDCDRPHLPGSTFLLASSAR